MTFRSLFYAFPQSVLCLSAARLMPFPNRCDVLSSSGWCEGSFGEGISPVCIGRMLCPVRAFYFITSVFILSTFPVTGLSTRLVEYFFPKRFPLRASVLPNCAAYSS